MAGISWSREEDDIVRKMASAGSSLDEMKEVLLSRTAHAIEQYCKKQGILLGYAAKKPQVDHEAYKRWLKGIGEERCI